MYMIKHEVRLFFFFVIVLGTRMHYQQLQLSLQQLLI